MALAKNGPPTERTKTDSTQTCTVEVAGTVWIFDATKARSGEREQARWPHGFQWILQSCFSVQSSTQATAVTKRKRKKEVEAGGAKRRQKSIDSGQGASGLAAASRDMSRGGTGAKRGSGFTLVMREQYSKLPPIDAIRAHPPGPARSREALRQLHSHLRAPGAVGALSGRLAEHAGDWVVCCRDISAAVGRREAVLLSIGQFDVETRPGQVREASIVQCDLEAGGDVSCSRVHRQDERRHGAGISHSALGRALRGMQRDGVSIVHHGGTELGLCSAAGVTCLDTLGMCAAPPARAAQRIGSPHANFRSCRYRFIFGAKGSGVGLPDWFMLSNDFLAWLLLAEDFEHDSETDCEMQGRMMFLLAGAYIEEFEADFM